MEQEKHAPGPAYDIAVLCGASEVEVTPLTHAGAKALTDAGLFDENFARRLDTDTDLITHTVPSPRWSGLYGSVLRNKTPINIYTKITGEGS